MDMSIYDVITQLGVTLLYTNRGSETILPIGTE
jgi:hypothetical protein